MTDFNYRGVSVQDCWPRGARTVGSQTRRQARRREDGAQRWSVELQNGEILRTFTRSEMRAAIRLLRPSRDQTV